MSVVNATKINAILKKHHGAEMPLPPATDGQRDPLAVLVHAFLLWDASASQARDAHAKLMSAIVDVNELRVSLPQETAAAIGVRYPRSLERAQRLKATLNDIYRREHAVSLARLTANAKRDARSYIESLEGIVPFVAARTLLMCYGVHGVPVDEQLRDRLVEAGAVDPGADPAEVSAALGRHVKAEVAEPAHAALLAFIEAQAPPPKRRSAATASGSGSKSSGARRPRSPRSASKS